MGTFQIGQMNFMLQTSKLNITSLNFNTRVCGPNALHLGLYCSRTCMVLMPFLRHTHTHSFISYSGFLYNLVGLSPSNKRPLLRCNLSFLTVFGPVPLPRNHCLTIPFTLILISSVMFLFECPRRRCLH